MPGPRPSPDSTLRDLALFAAHICQVSIALISLSDEDGQQFIVAGDAGMAEVARAFATFAESIPHPGWLLEVPDTRLDPRFADHSLVTTAPHLRCYAGSRLIAACGRPLGYLHVIGCEPHKFSDAQLEALSAVARHITAHLEAQREPQSQRLGTMRTYTQERLSLLFNTDLDCMKVISPEGSLLEMNPAGLAMIEADSLEQVRGRRLLDLVAPEYRAAFRDLHARVMAGGTGSLLFECLGLRGGRRWMETQAVPLWEKGLVHALLGIMRDVTERRWAERQATAEHRLLELLVQDVPLLEVLSALSREYEQLLPGTLCSVLLLDADGRRLRPGAAPSLPVDYITAIDGTEIGPRVGSCGTAAYTGRTVVVSDIASDPLWSDCRELALSHGLRACWSVPIRCWLGKVVGTFALYYREPRAPRPEELATMDRGTYLAGLAILRHHALNELTHSEIRFRKLLQAAPDAILIVDRERAITLANTAAEALFNYAPGMLTGRMIEELVPMAARAGHAALCMGFFQDGRSRPMGSGAELRACRQDGTEFAVEIMLGPLQLDDAALVLCIVRDVTERKLVKARLVRTQERLQQAASAGGVGLWDWDLRTDRIYYSPEWKRQIGYAEAEISDSLGEWSSRVHPEDLPRALEAVQAHLRSESGAHEVEFRFRHKDGSYRHILSRGSKVLGEDGTPLRMLGSHVDITERVELQNQFLQAQKMESVGRLAGGIAHDFNNMLAVINGYAELIRMGLPPEHSLSGYVREITKAGRRSAELTRQLLAFSRQQILEPQVFDLTQLLLELDGMLGRLIGEDIEVRTLTAREPVWTSADPGQIHQVILNLVVNARDAMPQGGELLLQSQYAEVDAAMAARYPDTAPGPYVKLTVSDTGSGMDSETLTRIFEPFFTTKEIGKGTGLGLSTVYGIVRQSGGIVEVESAPGHGTSFHIYLPGANAPPEAVAGQAASEVARGGETILVVEDEQMVRTLLVEVLTSASYTVLEAMHGEEALQVMAQHEGFIHLLLTDVVMPQMSGCELAEQVRGRHPETAVLFMSGYTDDSVMRYGILEQEVGFLRKPFSPGELAQRVREVLDQRTIHLG